MMEKEGNYSGNFPGLDYNNPTDVQTHHDHNQHQDKMTTADYMPNNNPTDDDQPLSSNFYGSSSFDKLSFADVMQFAEFGPKLALNQTKTGTLNEDEAGIFNNNNNNIDPVYFLKFPVLNDRPHDHGNNRDLSLMASEQALGGNNDPETGRNAVEANNNRGKRKRARSIKTSEEVESQRMTHIAVERNRRKQMNEHLRVLRSLMPSSYVQRGDQASIIGGAIEFVRELEQLLQCLESQKRRRLYGDTGQRTVNDPSSVQQPHPVNQPPLMFSPTQIMGNDYEGKNNNNNNISDHVVEYETETAESKSCLADVEVKELLGAIVLLPNIKNLS
ncbi:Transcription factor FAMA [Striga hermonthica]|uniref:Transcription factor FAMA n=1 Tax=Striga hermonthica TaxID=68872 RepID=A0A9N7P0D8_STRHE|nr:Transcription factor FAMA [Striga hermonthica]